MRVSEIIPWYSQEREREREGGRERERERAYFSAIRTGMCSSSRITCLAKFSLLLLMVLLFSLHTLFYVFRMYFHSLVL